MGNTYCYKYDLRGRKIAEWGTALQPACFGYDDMDNMTTLRTFRSGTETISTDPSERTDGDVTTWAFHPATGLELSKTYADDTTLVKTYDAYNRLATETDARGNVKTHSYEPARGLLLGTDYTVVDGTAETSARIFSYNHLGQLTQQVDDAGVRIFSYNVYGERETDSLQAGGVTHLITEQRDNFGRSTGFVYSKNGTVQHTVTTGYGSDGRISSAGFTHGGTIKQFNYEYFSDTNLLHKLTKPNNMTLTQSYEAQRDLLTGMAYHRGSTLVAQREYTYDVLERPTARTTSRQGNVVNDSFIHNSRSELASAQVNGETYGYDYDNIGNRRMAMEAGDHTFYEANELNQYTDITGSENETDFSFTPEFDADGNQTSIKTETGIWTAVYNAENRPICFTNEATGTVVTCAYDSIGRRSVKQVTVNGTVTLHQRYLYRGYLQIAACDLTRNSHPCLWLITWDPTQPEATRPLAIQINGTWYTYGWDLTKNVCEIYSNNGYISTTYTYAPYGDVTALGSISQPIQWSSEYFDAELKIYYYNYRYYLPLTASWNQRDFVAEDDEYNIYKYAPSMDSFDYLGLKKKCQVQIIWGHGGYVNAHIEKEHNNYDPETTAFGPFGCYVNPAPQGYQIPNFPDLRHSILGTSTSATNAGKNPPGSSYEDASKGFVAVFKDAINTAKAEAVNICKKSSCPEVKLIFKGIKDRSGEEGTQRLRNRLEAGKYKYWHKWSSNRKESINCRPIQKAIEEEKKRKEKELKKKREKAKKRKRKNRRKR
ncbi:MAG: RHS repeat protein [Akkermansia sp.]|nr:RHS repeat protein [Akkermansia sp.]